MPRFGVGVMLNSHSPPSSTPLEPCRVVPYMNVPALRGISLAPGSVALSNYERLSAAPFSQQGTAFSAINSAFISAAHQVTFLLTFTLKAGPSLKQLKPVGYLLYRPALQKKTHEGIMNRSG
ncbi:hypothetical protein NQ317_007118 [Molorchus minor]|uniref:Uncharacterized protein n=1 Tax=Molorchus minor TaxID=1323400 RepID=A0ABQ9JXK0_9CUCU|nr:hypothetical protein NQ317_007118 [Molorchus minor]